MRSRTLWMPCKLKHDLTETLKHLRTGKTFKSYVHVKGKLISHMDSDAVEEAWLAIATLAKGRAAATFDAECNATVQTAFARVPVIEGWRAARAAGFISIASRMATVHQLRPAAVSGADAIDEVVCMGCIWPGELPHDCGHKGAA